MEKPTGLAMTGERFIPGMDIPGMEGQIEIEHLHRYALAREFAYGKRVLDIACGEGYGSDLLAGVATLVTGVDISEEAVEHARDTYSRANLKFLAGSCADIPLPDASVDLVVSFETIEHHAEHVQMMLEIQRVLVPGGVLIISSPDKHQYSDVPNYRNEYHVKELYLNEFSGLLRAHFRNVRIFGQRVFCGSIVAAINESPAPIVTLAGKGEAVERLPGIGRPVYFVAIASDADLPSLPLTAYDGQAQLIGARDELSAQLRASLAAAETRTGELQKTTEEYSSKLGQCDAQIAVLGQAAAERDAQIATLGQAVGERDGQIASLGQAVAERDVQIATLGQAISERDVQIATLGQAISERDAQIATLGQAVAECEAQIANLGQSTADRCAQIEHLRQAAADREAALAAMRASTCWRLTAPLRMLKTTISNTRSVMNPRALISAGTRTLYRRLPVPVHMRLKLKDRLFSAFPALFRHTAAYRRWEAFSDLPAKRPDCPPDPPTNPKFEVQDPQVVVWSSLVRQMFSEEGEEYVAHSAAPAFGRCVRAIAFYLPQYHPIPENDQWWGKGFTEWTNVTRAKPQFVGHYQPHLPADLGFYDLRVPEVQERQIELAKAYGVDGFCFYFYWFAGKTLLELPLTQYLNNRDLDLPFCLCWANENWTRRWDGLDSDILMAQQHSPEDDLAFIAHVSQYLRDPRYIRINGRPLLLVYRPSLLPSARETATRWRIFCRNEGVGEIFLAYTQSFENVDPASYGFDAAIEFPPNNSAPPLITDQVSPINPSYRGAVYDWRVFVERSRAFVPPHYKFFRGVCPSWDNDARKPGRGATFLHSSPDGYREWLFNAAVETARRIPHADERLVFINAWNEWAEGTHLEPDQRYGYAYLEATRKALTLSALAFLEQPVTLGKGKGIVQANQAPRVWVIIHAFYPELLAEMFEKLKDWRMPFGMLLTAPQEKFDLVSAEIDSLGVSVECLVCENRGRDILPFLKAVKILRNRRAKILLKLHTKKSIHRPDGDRWRADLLSRLLDAETAHRILDEFDADPKLGLVGPSGHVVPLSYFWNQNERAVMRLVDSMNGKRPHPEQEMFVAGSMFFARLDALSPLVNLELHEKDFESERGQVDGTLAHAIERSFALVCKLAGYAWDETDRFAAAVEQAGRSNPARAA